MINASRMITSPFPRVSSGGGVPFTPTVLNSAYTHGQFWVPAGAITPGVTEPCVIETYEETVAPKATYTVAKFAGTVDSWGFFTWAFKADFMAVPSASLLLKMAPIWFAKTTAVAPNNVVEFDGYASNLLLGTSINTGIGNSPNLEQIAPATAFQITGGKTANAQASIPLTVGDDVLSATNWNFVSLGIERHAVTDTFAGDVFLLGIGIQFAVNFSNVAVWPT